MRTRTTTFHSTLSISIDLIKKFRHIKKVVPSETDSLLWYITIWFLFCFRFISLFFFCTFTILAKFDCMLLISFCIFFAFEQSSTKKVKWFICNVHNLFVMLWLFGSTIKGARKRKYAFCTRKLQIDRIKKSDGKESERASARAHVESLLKWSAQLKLIKYYERWDNDTTTYLYHFKWLIIHTQPVINVINQIKSIEMIVTQ